MLPHSSLRARLLLLVGLALVLLVGFAFLARVRLTHRAQAEWREDAVRLVETAAASHVEALRRTTWLLRAFSRVPAVRAPSPELCTSLFADFYDSRDHYTAFGIARPDGMTVCTEPAGDPLDLSPRPYFREAVATRRPTVGDYHIGAVTGTPMVTLAVPVLHPDSSVASVLAAGIDLGRLESLPAGVTLPPGAHLTVFARDGRVLLHAPDSTPAPGDTVDAGVLALARASPGDTVARVVVGGRARTFAIEPLEFAGSPLDAWAVVSFDPSWVEAQIAEASRFGVVGVALAATLLLAGVWAGVEFLVLRRIQTIVGAAERLGRGDLGARSGVSGGSDEIGRLGRAFDTMADNLEAARTAETERARRQVRESEERLRLLAETIDEVFWIWDPREERYVYLSPAFDEIWGFPRARLLEDADVWTESMHPDDRDAMASRMIDRGTLPEGEHEYRIVRPDGSVRWIDSRTFAVREGLGPPVRYLGVAQDVTERKELEDALLHATKLEALGRLAAGIAHDFNNILTAIQGHAQFLGQRLKDHPDVQDDLEEIAAGVTRAAGLTRQLLTFSRKQAVQARVLDLERVVRGTAKMLERLIGEDVEIVLDLAGDVPLVEADVHQMEQVILNLAVNARDAMSGGGTLRIATGRTRVEVTEALTADVVRAGVYATLTVEDDGTGMRPDTLDHVFEPFFTTKPPGQGTGLGLATVYGVVKQAGGSIEVESEAGVGTRFVVYLPMAEARAEEVEEPDEAPPGGPFERSVLLVEDEASVRSVLIRMLEEMGCRVTPADSAEAALEVMGRGERPDLLVTDVVMPGMNGIELYRRLQDLDPELPVVFMSGYPGYGREDGLLSGKPFLHKPFSREDVAKALDRALAAV